MAHPDENKFQTGSNPPQANESSDSEELILLEDEEEITVLEDFVEPQKKRAPSLLKKENLPGLSPQAANSIQPDQVVEEEWGYETTHNGFTAKVSLAIITLLVAAIIGAGFYFRHKKASREEEVATDTKASQKLIIKPLTEKDLNEGRFKYTKIKKAINAFLNAGSIEEILPLIRHPKRVEPLLRDYYSRNDFQPRNFDDFTEFTQATLSGYPFWVTSIKKSDGNLAPMLIEQQKDKFLIDWETYVTYQPHDIESLVKKRPAGEFTIRCKLETSHLNIYEYSDEKRWLSLALDIPNTAIQLRAYADLNEFYSKRLQWQQRRTKSHLYAILKIRFPQETKVKDSVEIVSFDSPYWAYIRDPSKSQD